MVVQIHAQMFETIFNDKIKKKSPEKDQFIYLNMAENYEDSVIFSASTDSRRTFVSFVVKEMCT